MHEERLPSTLDIPKLKYKQGIHNLLKDQSKETLEPNDLNTTDDQPIKQKDKPKPTFGRRLINHLPAPDPTKANKRPPYKPMGSNFEYLLPGKGITVFEGRKMKQGMQNLSSQSRGKISIDEYYTQRADDSSL